MRTSLKTTYLRDGLFLFKDCCYYYYYYYYYCYCYYYCYYYYYYIQNRLSMRSCVLTASVIKCWWITLIDFFDQHLDQHLDHYSIDILINTQYSIHLINSQSIVGQVSTDLIYMYNFMCIYDFSCKLMKSSLS